MRLDPWSITLRHRTTILIIFRLLLRFNLLLNVVHDKTLQFLFLNIFLIHINVDIDVAMVNQNGRLLLVLGALDGRLGAEAFHGGFVDYLLHVGGALG